MDTKRPPFTQSSGRIVEYEGQIGMVIDGEIPPSFKDGMYHVSAAFSGRDLIAARCGCEAGGEVVKLNDEMEGVEEKRCACVHINALIYSGSIEIMDGLAEHALVEFAASYHQTDERKLDQGKRTELATAICTLIEAVRSRHEVNLTERSPYKLLEKFQVGTELGRGPRPPPPADPAELGPIHGWKRASPETKAKVKMKLECATSVPRYQSNTVEMPVADKKVDPDYVTISTLLHLLHQELTSREYGVGDADFIGLRLLEERAQAKARTTNKTQLKYIQSGLKVGLKKMKVLATHRSQVRTERKKEELDDKSGEKDITSEVVVVKNDPPLTRSSGARKKLPISAGKTKPKVKKKSNNKCLVRSCGAYLGEVSHTRRVPPFPPIPDESASKVRWETFYRKKFHRAEFFDRCGHPRAEANNRKLHRICGSHRMVQVKKSYSFKFFYKGEKRERMVEEENTQKKDRNTGMATFLVPHNDGPAATPATVSGGVGRDRELQRRLTESRNEFLERCGGSEQAKQCFNLVQSVCEEKDGGWSSLASVNGRLLKDIEVADCPRGTPQRKKPKIEHDDGVAKKQQWDVPPEVDFSTTDATIKTRTGFVSLFHLLAYVVICCDGDIDKITTRTSCLTWLEEWFLYCEFTWAHSQKRWKDKKESYKINERILSDIVLNKLRVVKDTVYTWPRYATHEEDTKLRSSRWNDRYGDSRVIMWDNTNIDFQGKPSDADLQRLTYSAYYGGNVLKGGIFLQLCGWMGGWDLWHGAVSDTDYFERSGLLESQQEFQKNDESSGRSFTNILDKGYRVLLAAWRAGLQMVLQPTFRRSDRKFRGEEVLSSACIATDRAANERAVNRMKTSWFLAHGMHPKQNLDVVADVWLCWGFQTNFMFKPVLN